MPLTRNERNVLGVLLRKRNPTLREISDRTGISPEGVRKILSRLQRKEYVRREPGRARSSAIREDLLDEVMRTEKEKEK